MAAPTGAGCCGRRDGIHPAVLDSVLHALGLALDTTETRLPFCWRGVSLHAAGAGGGVQARLSSAGRMRSPSTWPMPRIAGADGGLAGPRPISAEQLSAAVSAGRWWPPTRAAGSDVVTSIEPQ